MCSLLNICWQTVVYADSLLRLIGTKKVMRAATADITELQEVIFSDIITPPQLLSRVPPSSLLFSLILLLHLPGRPGDVIKGQNKARAPGTHHVCLSPFLCNKKPSYFAVKAILCEYSLALGKQTCWKYFKGISHDGCLSWRLPSSTLHEKKKICCEATHLDAVLD